MRDKNGYPTEEALNQLRSFKLTDDTIALFLLLLQETWWRSEWGIDKKRQYRGFIRLTLHTGGWSGNEDIIDALQENTVLWNSIYLSRKPGGHWQFKIPINS